VLNILTDSKRPVFNGPPVHTQRPLPQRKRLLATSNNKRHAAPAKCMMPPTTGRRLDLRLWTRARAIRPLVPLT